MVSPENRSKYRHAWVSIQDNLLLITIFTIITAIIIIIIIIPLVVAAFVSIIIINIFIFLPQRLRPPTPNNTSVGITSTFSWTDSMICGRTQRF